MKTEVFNQLCAILRTCKTQLGHEWTEDSTTVGGRIVKGNDQTLREKYMIVCWDKPDGYGQWLRAEIIKRFQWRPEPSELQSLYPEYLGFNTDPTSMFAEIEEARDRHGLYAMPSPDFPGLMIEGPPVELTSQPGVEAVLRRMGGWDAICTEEAREALYKRFERAYKGVLETARTNPAVLETSAQKQLDNTELGRKQLAYTKDGNDE